MFHSASSFSVSAPGKIILFGEHSVVHEKKAIACAIGSRITVSTTFEYDNRRMISVSMPSLYSGKMDLSVEGMSKIEDNKDASEIHSSIEEFCNSILNETCSDFTRIAMSCLLFAYYKVFYDCSAETSPSVSLHVQSELPIGAGLGSSAAFNTAIACSFLIISGKVSMPEKCGNFGETVGKNHLDKVNSLALELERIVHKTPSGIDNSIATFGGAVSFHRGFLKKIEKMPKMQLLIVDTQVPRSTMRLVAGVKEFLAKFPDIVNPILDAMHGIVIAAEEILRNIYDYPRNMTLIDDLGKLMVTNQCLLKSIGVSHSALDKICCIAKKHCFPAKLTGAGGGGCAIILLNKCEENSTELRSLRDELVKEGFTCSEAALGGPGVLVNLP